MPADFTIDPGRKLVISRGSGVFTKEDFLDHMAQVKADPRFRPDFNQIVDCRAITKLDVPVGEFKFLAGRSVFGVSSRRAFVASSDEVFGLCRILAAYFDIKVGQEVRVFREILEAYAWLGVPPESVSDAPKA